MKQAAEEGEDKEAVTQTVESADSMQTVTQTAECSDLQMSQHNKETLQIMEG